MQAMVLERIGPVESRPLQLRQAPVPEPGPGEVRVRVRCCALCRTDLHIIEGDLPAPTLPRIVGHQAVGVVDALGPDCTHLKLGQRVGIAWLRHADGTCLYCQRGQENLCVGSRYTGYHADGGYASYAVVPEAFAYEIPPLFDDVQASPLLCAGLIGYRSLNRAQVPAGGRLLLVGFGSSAHVVLPIALRRGYTVDVLTRSPNHQQLALQMGAAWAGDDPAGLPEPADSAILFAPSGTLVPVVLQNLRHGGKLAIAGIHLSPIPALDYDRHLYYEREVRSVTANTRQDGRDLFHEAAEARLTLHTVTYPLAQANEALLDMKRSRIDGTGVLLMPD